MVETEDVEIIVSPNEDVGAAKLHDAHVHRQRSDDGGVGGKVVEEASVVVVPPIGEGDNDNSSSTSLASGAVLGVSAAASASSSMDENSCELLGQFGIWVQVALGILCFSTLIIKRYRESPMRPWSVFLLDSSKQLMGASTIHILNLIFASILSGTHSGDPCNWYWINIVVDCTLGVFFLYLYLKQAKRWLKLEGMNEFGFYGDPPRFRIWIKQILVWQAIVCAMKFTMVLVMVIGHIPLKFIASCALVLFDGHPQAKLVVVMMLTPLVMNTIQLWLIDNFIKKQQPVRDVSSPRTFTSTATRGTRMANIVGGTSEEIPDSTVDFDFDLTEKNVLM